MIAIDDGDSLYSANGNACARQYLALSRFSDRELSRQLPTKSLTNHQMPLTTPPPPPPFRAPKGSCHAPMLLHTRIFQSVKIDWISRERDCIIEGCELRVDGMPSWLRRRRSIAMKFESDIGSFTYIPTLLWTWSDINTRDGECGEKYIARYFQYYLPYLRKNFRILRWNESTR